MNEQTNKENRRGRLFTSQVYIDSMCSVYTEDLAPLSLTHSNTSFPASICWYTYFG
jgi:hypothetical protein